MIPAGPPALSQTPAWVDCRLVDTVESDDHAVIVVEVTDAGLREESPEVLTPKELGLNYGG